MKNKLIKWLGGYTAGDMRRYVTERNTRELNVERDLRSEKLWSQMLFNHATNMVRQRDELAKENIALGQENEKLEAELENVNGALFEANRTIQHLRMHGDSTTRVTKKPKKKKKK